MPVCDIQITIGSIASRQFLDPSNRIVLHAPSAQAISAIIAVQRFRRTGHNVHAINNERIFLTSVFTRPEGCSLPSSPNWKIIIAFALKNGAADLDAILRNRPRSGHSNFNYRSPYTEDRLVSIAHWPILSEQPWVRPNLKIGGLR